jgi:hypothetical protein
VTVLWDSGGAVAKCWPDTDQQRCWVHKTANMMGKLPKAMQPKVKEVLHNIWQAETREKAYKTFDHCIERFSPKYPNVDTGRKLTRKGELYRLKIDQVIHVFCLNFRQEKLRGDYHGYVCKDKADVLP